MCRFRYDSKYRNKDSTTCDGEGAKEHVRGEDIAEDETREEGVPEEGHSAERSEDDDGERGDLDEGANDV